MLPISVCIITKNEEKYIETCLQNLKKYNWEIIVTDTGSTDHTLEICEKYAHQIHHFDWINDFSAARNFCVSKASNDWILSVDSDEYLTNKQTPDELLPSLISCLSHPESAGMVKIINPQTASFGPSTNIEPVARFFNRKFYRYEGKVHEQPMPINGTKPSYFETPFCLYHEGYGDTVTLHQKAERNITLLKREIEITSNDPYLYFQLGQSYFVMGDMQQAYATFQKGLEFEVDPDTQYVRTMVESYGYSMLALKKYEEALSFESIYDAFCSHADFVFLMGLIYMNNALFDEAIAQFLQATKLQDYSVQGINSYLAYYNIGVIYECAGVLDEALKYYKMCGNYEPAFAGINRIKI